ncbi:MAG: CsbD family protein [Pseudomonadota bacterium]
MIWDQIEGNWKQLKGNVKEQWGRLTDDDLDVIDGQREALSGKIQATYGLTEDDAHNQISDWETMITNVFKPDEKIVKDSGAKALPDDKE